MKYLCLKRLIPGIVLFFLHIIYQPLGFAEDVHCKDECQENISDYFSNIYPKTIEPSLKDGFDRTGWTILASGAILTLIAHNNDKAVRKKFLEEEPLSEDAKNFGSIWGGGVPSVAIAGALLYFDRESGLTLAESIAFTSATHVPISILAGRPRPGPPHRKTSFPSGHSANSWTMATSLSYSYGWRAAIPTYLAAVVTIAARIADDKHWLSDTVAGATIGYFWGRATSFHHDPQNIIITPIVSHNQIGFGLSYEF